MSAILKCGVYIIRNQSEITIKQMNVHAEILTTFKWKSNKESISSFYGRMLGLTHIYELTVHKISEYDLEIIFCKGNSGKTDNVKCVFEFKGVILRG